VASTFGLFIKFAEIIIKMIKTISKAKSAEVRRDLIFSFLVTYFALRGILKTGRDMLILSGKNPKKSIHNKSEEEIKKYIRAFDIMLIEQRQRFLLLAEYYHKDTFLDLFDPSFRIDLEKVAGSKFNNTLTSVGAALAFYKMSPVDNPEDTCISYVSLFYPNKSDVIDYNKAEEELNTFDALCERIRAVIHEVATDEEVIALSAEAEIKADPYGGKKPALEKLAPLE